MKHREDYRFSQVPTASIPRSVFNRSHQYKTAFNAGLLIPFYVDEVLPGDTFKCKVSIFARLFTMLFPLMENIYLDVHFFFVPMRLVWSNFQKFCGEQQNPGDSTSYVIPTMSVSPTTGSLFDYMGLPVKSGSTFVVNALPFRCYNRIYNEWYRDQNLQNSVSMVTSDGPDSSGAYSIYPRGKRHDYFTGCLPFPQKGPGVSLPLGSLATVVRTASNSSPSFEVTDSSAVIQQLRLNTTVAASQANSTPGLEPAGGGNFPNAIAALSDVRWGNQGIGLSTDLSTATGPTINSLRQAFQIQKMQERDARGGTRYTEKIRAHFGVVSPDARLQRPEYLGGGTVPIVIQPVPQTGPLQTGTTPLATLAAFGTAANHELGFTKSFVEHGYLMGIVSGRTDLTYFQGLKRLWKRSTIYDFYWPSLAHLGEQAVLNQEIYADGSANDTAVFGYQERWAEYKYNPSMVTGIFRPTAPGTVAIWHAAQNFATLPLLNSTFIQEPGSLGASSPLNRLKAVTTEPDFIMDSYFDVQCARPMPLYSVPGLTDHF